MPIVRHRRPSPRSYPLWFACRTLIRPVLTVWPVNRAGLAGLFLIDRLAAIGPKPRGVARERMSLAERGVELIMPTRPSRRGNDTAVLYLHGGAFVVCGLGTHRSVAARISRATELPVFSLEYRQLPAAGVGTSVHDALEAYRELVTARGFRHVVVAGDSAGGFLAAKVTELAPQAGLPMPTALVGFSPLLDLDLGDNPDRTSRDDAYLPMSTLIRLAPQFDRGPVPLRGARRIPSLPAEDFPPTIIITAENEMLEPDAVDLVEQLDVADVPAELHSYARQVHAFPVLTARHPETLAAIEKAADFIERALRDADAGRRDSRQHVG